MKIRLLASIAATAITILTASIGAAQEFTWKMGHIGARDSTYLITTMTLPERIAEATDGRIKIELFETLYAGSAQVPALRAGNLDIIGGPNNYLSGETPIFGLGHLPSLIDTPAEYQRVIEEFLGDVIAKEWDEKYNGKVVAHGMFDRQVIVRRSRSARSQTSKA